MPVTGDWDNAARSIYRFTFTGRWTFAGLKEVHLHYKSSLAQVDFLVVTLVDMRHARIAPASNIFDGGVLAFSEQLINQDIIVLVTTSRMLRQTASTFIRILAGLYPDRGLTTLWTGSEAEAYRLIEQHWCDQQQHGRC